MTKSLIELRAHFLHLRRWRKSVEQAQPRTILPPRTILSAPVIGCISRRLPGLGRTRCIGANPSGVGRFKFDKRKSLKMRVGKFQALPKLARPVAEKATGLFLVFRGFGPGYLRVVAER